MTVWPATRSCLAYGSAAYADPSIGAGKTVSVTGVQIAGGADQGSYVLANANGSAVFTASGDIVAPVSEAQRTAAVPSVLAPVAPLPVPTTPCAALDFAPVNAGAALTVPTAATALSTAVPAAVANGGSDAI